MRKKRTNGDFRFFTLLRCVQNDRGKGCYVMDDRINLLFKSKVLCVSNVNRT